jgi:hypothetical protein
MAAGTALSYQPQFLSELDPGLTCRSLLLAIPIQNIWQCISEHLHFLSVEHIRDNMSDHLVNIISGEIQRSIFESLSNNVYTPGIK